MAKLTAEDVARREAARGADGKFGQWKRHRPMVQLTAYDTQSQSYSDHQKQVSELVESRAQILRESGAVEATWLYAHTDIKNTSGRDVWWDRAAVGATWGGDTSNIPMIPDDESLSFGAGKARSGKRRTYRKLYPGPGDSAVRMPSRAAINRFCDRTGTDVVRIPTQVQGPSGVSTQMWMVAQRDSTGQWEVRPETAVGPAGENAALIVQAALERRQVSRAQFSERPLRGDASTIRYDNFPQGSHIQLTRKSGALEKVAFIPTEGDKGIIAVQFRGSKEGKVYGYEADQAAYQRFLNADSPGRYYTRYIKYELDDNGERIRDEDGKLKPNPGRKHLTQCKKCLMWMTQGSSHKCRTTSEADRLAREAASTGGANRSFIKGLFSRR